MRVVIDTNVFCKDYWMSSTNFRVLREGLHLVPADLKVPEVVVDEVVNRFKEDLQEAVERAEKAHSAFGRLLPAEERPPGIEIEIDLEVQKYYDWLSATLTDIGAEILPYPNIPHKEVVRRDLERRKPFKKGGSGYRDFLIWESIRKLMLGLERVVLITANKADFGEGPRVTEDLAQDIVNPSRIEVVQTLEAFNECYIVPKLDMVEEMRAKLESEAGFLFDIPGWLKENLVDTLRNEEYLETFVLGFPEGVGSLYVREVISLKSLKVNEVLKLSDEEVLVRAKVEVEVLFSVDINWDDYVNHEEVHDYFGFTGPFSTLWTDHCDTLTLGFNFVLDHTGTELVDSELGSIDGPCASADWSSW